MIIERRALVCGFFVCTLLAMGNMSRLAGRATETMMGNLPQPAGCTDDTSFTLGLSAAGTIGANQSRAARFLCGSTVVEVRVGVWYEQRPGKEAVSEQNDLVSSSRRFSGIDSDVDLGDGLVVRAFQQAQDDKCLLVWWWYAVGESVSTNGFGTKLREAINAMLMRPRPTAVIALVAESRDPDAARALLQSYAGVLWTWYRSTAVAA